MNQPETRPDFRRSEKPGMHLDAKHDEKLGCWLVWCRYRQRWASVTDDWFRAGCGSSVAARFTEARP